MNLYEMLIKINPSPVTILNKSIVVSQISGPANALEEIINIKELQSYYLYHTTLAEFYTQLEQYDSAKSHLQTALSLTSSNAEILLIKKRIEKLQAKS